MAEGEAQVLRASRQRLSLPEQSSGNPGQGGLPRFRELASWQTFRQSALPAAQAACAALTDVKGLGNLNTEKPELSSSPWFHLPKDTLEKQLLNLSDISFASSRSHRMRKGSEG